MVSASCSMSAMTANTLRTDATLWMLAPPTQCPWARTMVSPPSQHCTRPNAIDCSVRHTNHFDAGNMMAFPSASRYRFVAVYMRLMEFQLAYINLGTRKNAHLVGMDIVRWREWIQWTKWGWMVWWFGKMVTHSMAKRICFSPHPGTQTIGTLITFSVRAINVARSHGPHGAASFRPLKSILIIYSHRCQLRPFGSSSKLSTPSQECVKCWNCHD